MTGPKVNPRSPSHTNNLPAHRSYVCIYILYNKTKTSVVDCLLLLIAWLHQHGHPPERRYSMLNYLELHDRITLCLKLKVVLLG